MWGFFVPASAAVPEEECLSADGSLRYIRRRSGAPAFNSSALTLSDVATGDVYFDGAGLEYAGIREQTDGTLTLQFSQHRRSGVIHIYPREKVFRVPGEAGPGRPLHLLRNAVSDALGGAMPGPPGILVAAPVKRWAAWRSLVLISLGAAIAIAAGSYLTTRFAPPVSQQLTPIPRMPGAK